MYKKNQIRYSESFKLEVINYYVESGLTKQEVCKRYGIKGGATLNDWLRKFGKEQLINKTIRMETPDENKKLKELEKENRKLKEALSDAHMKNIVNQSMLEVTAEMMGLTVQELKKNLESRN